MPIGNWVDHEKGNTAANLAQTARAPDGRTYGGAADNIVNQRLVQLQLRKFGLRADVAANGLEVLEALERARYDVILMDCQMPEMDGYEATGRLRAEPRHAHIRVIAMTANAMQGDRERCFAAGMDGYLAKPIRKSELRATLARVVPTVPN